MQKNQSRKGFTLIELLVVVAIIGILAAISIPQFAEYSRRGRLSEMQRVAHNAATAEERYFIDTSTYTSDCNALPRFAQHKNISIACEGTETSFTITVTHANLPGVICTFKSPRDVGSSSNYTCNT